MTATPGDDARMLDRPRHSAACDAVSRFAWASLDADSAAGLWRELGNWVDWLRHRYQLGSRIPACWYRHGPVVEALTALMAAHHAAYPESEHDGDGPAAWHLQCLWPIVEQLTRISDFSSCRPDHCGYRTHSQTRLTGFNEFVNLDLSDRTPRLTNTAQLAPAASDAPQTLLVSDEDMAQLLAEHSAEPVETDDAGLAYIVRCSGRVWVRSRLAGGWIPERSERRRR